MRIKEGSDMFMDTATQHNPHCVEFDDGEFEEFDEDEMSTWKVKVSKRFEPRKPSTHANQLVTPNFHPKSVNQVQCCMQTGSMWDEELHKWMVHRDLLNHPNPKMRERWVQAGINEFARSAQGCKKGLIDWT